MSNFSIQEIINKAVMPAEERKKERWWASDLGKCLRGVYFARQGIEPPEKLDERKYRVFQAGRIFEDWVIQMLEKAGNGIKVERPETIYLPELDFSVRPDLIITLEDKKVLYEIKTVHSQKFHYLAKEKPDEHYLMQLWAGLRATGIEDGRLIYFSKDDLCVAEYKISLWDEEISKKAMDELELLNDCWAKQMLPPAAEPIINNKINWKARYCAFHTLCMNDQDWLSKAKQQLWPGKKSLYLGRGTSEKIPHLKDTTKL